MSYTVKDLKEDIADLPDDMEIIMQKDAEGNGYSPMAGADPNCIYVPNTTWYGEVYSLDWGYEDVLMDADEWDELKEKKDKALVLCPIN